MEEFVATLTRFFTEWGYTGLFLAAFVAGSVLPFSSELVLVVLIRLGLDPVGCLLSAAAGNTLGGMTCYWIGHLGKRDWITRYLKVNPEKLDKASRFLEGRGALFAFFTFLPYLGEAIAIVLGLMRSNVWITTGAMFVGKLLRYIVIVAVVEGVVSLF
ncbi:MAG TPA: DedA family protein [Candidatus Alistipes avicola]|uniref:DedA family protein n=1 Tax=Candidatus Alistipes avicola TaxID=2838432 RepID=A0A9D2IDI3_9BACT|nr:YqaA family protein [uncultured Alistipes sp.]HJA98102.1 DedA family protein [Candidatus Alistipes avicola]